MSINVLRPYILTFLLVSAVTVTNKVLNSELLNIALLYLLPVLISAAYWGRGPSIMASLLGVAAFDIFFVPPFLSFTVHDLRYLLSFVIFLLVAVTTGTMATKLRDQAEIARRRENRTAALYALSSKLAAETDLEGMAKTITKVVSETIDEKTVILMPGRQDTLEVLAAVDFRSEISPEISLDEKDYQAARWVFEHGEIAGRGSNNFTKTRGLYLPLKTEKKIVGVLGILFSVPEYRLFPEQLRLLEAFSNLAALAIVRLQLAAEAQQVRYLAQSEKLRTALLNSISHELRTPLASIIGAVTSLLDESDIYDQTALSSLLHTVKEGALRMNRLVGNLLDMARLESGMMNLKREWCDLQEILGVALRRVRDGLHDHPVKVDIPPDLPLVMVDFALIEQALVNLLDNALKYSPAESEISVNILINEIEIIIGITDKGPGIPEAERERVFEKFYRVSTPGGAGGTGLGLSICKGIVEAHGGKIWLEPSYTGGSSFIFSLPLLKDTPVNIPLEKGGDYHAD